MNDSPNVIKAIALKIFVLTLGVALGNLVVETVGYFLYPMNRSLGFQYQMFFTVTTWLDWFMIAVSLYLLIRIFKADIVMVKQDKANL